MKIVFCLIAIFLSASSNAQGVVKADVVNITPAISRDESGINSCGINFMVGSMEGEGKATVFDFSLNVYSDGYGLIKAGSQALRFSKAKGWGFDGKNARTPGPVLVWMAKRDDSVSVRPLRYTSADNKGYVIAPTDMADAAKLLFATVEGEPLQISIQYAGDRLHQVIGFRAVMSQDDRDAVVECVNGLAKRMDKDM